MTAVLRYLAVAHYGRGRGEWSEGEHPAFWQPTVEEAVAGRTDALKAATRSNENASIDGEAIRTVARELRMITTKVLQRLYPDAGAIADRNDEGMESAARETGAAAAIFAD